MKGSWRRQGHGSYEIRISLGYNPVTGKYDPFRETFYTDTSKPESAQEKQVKDYIAKKIYELKTGNRPAENNMNMVEFFKYWDENYVETQLKKSTKRTYRGTLKNHILPSFLSKIKLRDLTPLHIEQFYNGKRDKVSNGVLKDCQTVFGSALDRAYIWKFIPEKFKLDSVEPIPRKERIREKAKKKERITWTADQTLVFLNYAEKNCGRRYYIYLIAFTTGLRRGENLGLKWSRLNFAEHYYEIAGSVTEGEFEDYAKTEKSIGRVYMVDFVAKKLKKYSAQQVEDQLNYGQAYAKEDWVHCNALGERLYHPDTVTDKFKVDLLNCNKTLEDKLPIITLHDLRHTVATLLYDKFDVSLEKIAEILRHSDIRTTRDNYAHPTVEIQKGALQNINDLFG